MSSSRGVSAQSWWYQLSQVSHFFGLKNKATQYSLPFVRPSLTSFNAGNSLRQILGIFQHGAPLVTHSQILSTFQDGGRVEFPTLGIATDVKIPTHVHLTKSNSPGLPDPPILGQTIDRCITSQLRLKPRVVLRP